MVRALLRLAGQQDGPWKQCLTLPDFAEALERVRRLGKTQELDSHYRPQRCGFDQVE